jgi:heparosan-N-sulfate-glucuronate 5-epimerase
VIFATTGDDRAGFPRLLRALETLGSADELVVQYGAGRPPQNATRAEAFMSSPVIGQLIDQAEVVISPAELGTVLRAARAGHVPVVVPRQARLGEEIGDDELELAQALQTTRGAMVCWDIAQLAQIVGRVPRRGSARSASPPLTEAVGRALREAPDRGRGRIANFVSGTLGAYLEIGTDFRPQPPGARVDPNGLAGYYCDFTHKADPSLEADGVWLAEALSGAPWWSPMMVSQAALGFWERQLAGEDTLDRFIALADWLIRYGERDERGVGWGHDLAVPKYGISPGWRSGMTQGEAISVLLRAHAVTGEDRYRDTAAAAFAPFTADVGAGGVVRTLDGALVIEEYPTAQPTAVLNGWIFGLLGLHELALVDDRPIVSETLARTQAGLLTLLPRYDVGWWSRYSLGDYGRPDLAKPFYQRLHTVLLDAVDLIAPDPLLRATARRWERQINTRAMGRIAIDKVAFRAGRRFRQPQS